jgi:hypothetical protein
VKESLNDFPGIGILFMGHVKAAIIRRLGIFYFIHCLSGKEGSVTSEYFDKYSWINADSP